MERRRNNVGVVRLLLASAVIISHSVEFVDGSRDREVFTRVFHTLSLGDSALAAFFLLSGYLITQSYVSSRSISDYLGKRVLRVYPAFLAAFALSILLEAPLLGFETWSEMPRLWVRALELNDPVVGGMHLNMPMWSVFYEFRFYMVTLLFGTVGLFRRRGLVLAFTLMLLLAAFVVEHHIGTWRFHAIESLPLYSHLFGGLFVTARLGALYMVGTCAFLFWPEIERRLSAAAAGVSLVICFALFGIDMGTASFGLSTFGAVSLFWLAFKVDLGRLQRINDRWDISYGTYLYGWASGLLLVTLIPGVSIPWLAALTLVAAYGCGAASWWGLEKRAKELVRRPALGEGLRSSVPALS